MLFKKFFFLSNILLVANNFRVISIVEGVGVRFFVTISLGEAFRKRNKHSLKNSICNNTKGNIISVSCQVYP